VKEFSYSNITSLCVVMAPDKYHTLSQYCTYLFKFGVKFLTTDLVLEVATMTYC